MSDLTLDAKHQDWMEKMEEITHQLDLLNQNLSSISMVLAAQQQTLNLIHDKLPVKAKKVSKD